MMSKKQAIIILRVSTKEQREEGFSLEAQERLAIQYCQENDIAIAETHKLDETASKSVFRTKYHKILRAFQRSKEIQALIFDKFDRSSRNMLDWVTLSNITKNNPHKEVHFVRDNRVLSSELSPSDKLYFNIMAAMSENYIDNLKQEVKKGLKERVLNGLPPYKVRIGYKNVILSNKRRIVEIDEITKPIVMEMFQMAIQGGINYNDVRKAINKRLEAIGLKPFRSKSSIEQLMKDPFYYGYFYYDGALYKGSYPPLISKKEYDLIQKNMRNPNKSKGWKRDKLFNNMIKCGHCGLSVCGEQKIKKNRTNDKVRTYMYYRCSHYKQKCPDPYIEEKRLLDVFEDAVSNIHIDNELFSRIREYILKAHQARSSHYHTYKPDLQKRIADLERLRDQAYEDKLKGSIDEAFFNKRFNGWTDELAELNEELRDLEDKNETMLKRSLLTFELANHARNLYKNQNSEEKVKFLKLILSNSFLKDGKLEFEYKKPFDMVMEVSKTKKWWRELDLNQRRA